MSHIPLPVLIIGGLCFGALVTLFLGGLLWAAKRGDEILEEEHHDTL